jgi:hypothetical protein
MLVTTSASSGIGLVSTAIPPAIQTEANSLGGADMKQSVGCIETVGLLVGVDDGPADGLEYVEALGEALGGDTLGDALGPPVGLSDGLEDSDALGDPLGPELGP